MAQGLCCGLSPAGTSGLKPPLFESFESASLNTAIARIFPSIAQNAERCQMGNDLCWSWVNNPVRKRSIHSSLTAEESFSSYWLLLKTANELAIVGASGKYQL